MRLVDSDAAIHALSVASRGDSKDVIRNLVIRLLLALPTVDAVPVRHGKWLDTETFKRQWFRHHIFECSVCRNTLDMDGVNAGRGDANYCPNCGAKMDAERKNDETD